MLRNYSTIGIVLARKNYGEADRVITLLTKDFGKIRVLAKGIRKTKSKKRGHLEVFSLVKISVSQIKGMGLMTEAQIIDSYENIRKDLTRISLAYYFMEVASKLLYDSETNEIFFNTLVEFLTRLKKETQMKKLKNEFLEKMLIFSGYLPQNKKDINLNKYLEEILERKVNSVAIGKKMLS